MNLNSLGWASHPVGPASLSAEEFWMRRGDLVRTQGEDVWLQAGTLALAFQPPELWENKLLPFQSYSRSLGWLWPTSLKQTEYKRTEYKWSRRLVIYTHGSISIQGDDANHKK